MVGWKHRIFIRASAKCLLNILPVGKLYSAHSYSLLTCVLYRSHLSVFRLCGKFSSFMLKWAIASIDIQFSFLIHFLCRSLFPSFSLLLFSSPSISLLASLFRFLSLASSKTTQKLSYLKAKMWQSDMCALAESFGNYRPIFGRLNLAVRECFGYAISPKCLFGWLTRMWIYTLTVNVNK